MLYKILILLFISTITFGQYTSEHTGEHIDSVITAAGGLTETGGSITIPTLLDGLGAPYLHQTGNMADNDFLLKMGDVDGENNGTVVTVTDSITNIRLDVGRTELEVDGVNNKILLVSDSTGVRGDLDVDGSVYLSGISSDSTTTTTGGLWFNSSTGAIHRKF